MREKAIPTRTGAVIVYGPSRLRWVQRRWRAARRILAPTATGVALAGIALATMGWPVLGSIVASGSLVVFGPVGLALLMRPHVSIGGYQSLKLWRSVVKSTATIHRALPAMSGLVDVEEADELIREATWEIACLIHDQGRLGGARSEATLSRYGLAPDDPLRNELALRREALAEQAGELEREARQRADRLETLAREAAAFAHKQGAQGRAPAVAERARRALGRADATLAETVAEWRADDDPAAELTERMTAVLSAYHELSAPLTDRQPRAQDDQSPATEDAPPAAPRSPAPRGIQPGDIYEDCEFHPVLCTHRHDDGSVSGISLIDASAPRTCSLTDCGVEPLSVADVVHIREDFEGYVARRKRGLGRSIRRPPQRPASL